MEYKLINKRIKGDSIIRDAVCIDKDRATHFQVEMKNGLVYMRMKTRKVLNV